MSSNNWVTVGADDVPTRKKNFRSRMHARRARSKDRRTDNLEYAKLKQARLEKEIARLEQVKLEKAKLDEKIARLEKAALEAKLDDLEPEPEPVYQMIKAQGHTLRVQGQSANIPGQMVCTGAFIRPANRIDFRTVLNLTELFFPTDKANLFTATYGGPEVNIFDRVRNFFLAHKHKVMSSKYFIAAINKNKPAGSKRDLPNVNAAVVVWLLENLPHDVVFMDPLDLLKNPMLPTTDVPVNLTNLSAVVRHIRDNLAYHIPMDTTESNKQSTATLISYQRGMGNPNPTEKRKILMATGDPNTSFLHVRLTPGKYEYNGSNAGAPKLCYKEFGPAVAQLINQFTDFKEYLQFAKKTAVRRMYLVMDEFSGYSMFTVAAIRGFGLDRVTSILCYYRGDYSQFALVN